MFIIFILPIFIDCFARSSDEFVTVSSHFVTLALAAMQNQSTEPNANGLIFYGGDGVADDLDQPNL